MGETQADPDIEPFGAGNPVLRAAARITALIVTALLWVYLVPGYHPGWFGLIYGLLLVVVFAWARQKRDAIGALPALAVGGSLFLSPSWLVHGVAVLALLPAVVIPNVTTLLEVILLPDPPGT